MSDNNKAPSVVKKIILARPAGVDVEENTRETAETLRVKAEMERVEAEDARAGAESGRVNAEEIRVASEKERVSAESARAASENLRETAEKERASAETERATEELTRQASEADRESAEAERKTAEATRIETETSRVSAEALRVSAEAKRETKWNNASATAVTGEADADVVITDSGVVFNFTLPQGDKGNTGDTGATISSVTFKEYDSNGGAVYTITMTDGVTAEFTAPKGQKGDKGDIGDTGATGNGIESITLVSGNHAAGTTDTYRITFTNGETADFTVYNGANGEGAGDMLWEEFNARLNPSGKNGQIAFESELPTSEQKSAWSAKYNKPTGGIPKTDLASSVQTSLGKADTALQEHQDISGKADVSALTAHTGNADIHVTTANKTAWNAKYDKPSGGIPKSDLVSAVQSSLDKADSALQEHQDISGKANTPTFSQYTILTSGWSSGVYSFESAFPSATYDIEIELDSTATESQVEAWSSAKPTAVFGTNTMKALGDVPTVDIPVIVKAVLK